MLLMRPCLLVAFLVACAASQPNSVAVGSPTPPNDTAAAKDPQPPPNLPPNNMDASSNQPKPPAAGQTNTAGQTQTRPSEPNTISKTPVAQQHKLIVAEKLKRGLSNFINNSNPAPFFVPVSSVGSMKMQQLVAAGTKSSSSTPTIINDGPSADAVIKGPNRLVQARPLGGPLRWGRR